MQRQEIRNPQSEIRNSTGSPCIRVLRGREKKCIAGFQPAKVVLTQKELSRLRCRRDAGATIFSHDPCLRGEAFRWLSGFRHSSLEIDAQVELDLPHRAASRYPAEIERIHYC